MCAPHNRRLPVGAALRRKQMSNETHLMSPSELDEFWCGATVRIHAQPGRYGINNAEGTRVATGSLRFLRIQVGHALPPLRSDMEPATEQERALAGW